MAKPTAGRVGEGIRECSICCDALVRTCCYEDMMCVDGVEPWKASKGRHERANKEAKELKQGRWRE